VHFNAKNIGVKYHPNILIQLTEDGLTIFRKIIVSAIKTPWTVWIEDENNG
jgi:hypothetical protein